MASMAGGLRRQFSQTMRMTAAMTARIAATTGAPVDPRQAAKPRTMTRKSAIASTALFFSAIVVTAGCYASGRAARRAYLAYSTARVSRMTVTLIWPG